jgi:hypothetical protein
VYFKVVFAVVVFGKVDTGASSKGGGGVSLAAAVGVRAVWRRTMDAVQWGTFADGG